VTPRILISLVVLAVSEDRLHDRTSWITGGSKNVRYIRDDQQVPPGNIEYALALSFRFAGKGLYNG
jgi:hypothetical protein